MSLFFHEFLLFSFLAPTSLSSFSSCFTLYAHLSSIFSSISNLFLFLLFLLPFLPVHLFSPFCASLFLFPFPSSHLFPSSPSSLTSSFSSPPLDPFLFYVLSLPHPFFIFFSFLFFSSFLSSSSYSNSNSVSHIPGNNQANYFGFREQKKRRVFFVRKKYFEAKLKYEDWETFCLFPALQMIFAIDGSRRRK